MPSKSRRRGLLLLIDGWIHACVPGVPDCLCGRLGTRRAVSKGSKLESSPSGWYWFLPCFDAYREGKYKTSLEFAHKVKYTWVLAQSTCYRVELQATQSKGCSERCPPDSSDAEARHCQTSSRAVSDLVATGYGRTSDRRPLQSWPCGIGDEILLHIATVVKQNSEPAWPTASTIQMI